MSVLKLILSAAAPLPDIESFDRFLFIGPHPDDIEIGAGATAAKLAAAGKSVCFLICIDGRYGDGATSLRGDGLVMRRREEASASARKLGISDVRFLNFCDGGFYAENDLITAIARAVGDFAPDVIFTPDPCVTSECHIDHLNVGNAARRIACFAPYPNIMERYGASSADVKALAYYFTAKANRFVGTRGFLEKQLDSVFSCHTSQFPEGCGAAKSISMYLRLRAADFGIRSLRGCAEGFRVLGVTQMHCFPEAGE